MSKMPKKGEIWKDFAGDMLYIIRVSDSIVYFITYNHDDACVATGVCDLQAFCSGFVYTGNNFNIDRVFISLIEGWLEVSGKAEIVQESNADTKKENLKKVLDIGYEAGRKHDRVVYDRTCIRIDLGEFN